MRRFLGSKAASDKGKQCQRDPEDQTYESYDIPAPMSTPMEVLVEREVTSLAHDDQESSQPLSSSSTLVPPSPSGSARKQLPPGIRVPTHPYPYWHNHTPSSSQSSLESPVTPSHVSWLSGSATNPAGPSTPPGASTSSAPSPAPGRSSPNLFFPPPPPTTPPANAGRSKLIPMKSSHSLRVPGQEFQFGQLSPIVEQDYMSPEKRPVSLPSSSHEGPGTRSSTTHTMMTPVSPSAVTPVSPLPMNPVFSLAGGSVPIPPGPSYGGLVPFAKRRDEEGGDSPRPSPVFSNFISRPLNRSISLSSTRTHQSGGSASTPPVIPPLDLRPAFPGPFLPTATPTSLRGYIDGFSDRESNSDRRESFATAKTGNRESRYSGTQQEHFVDAESGPKTPGSSQESSQSSRQCQPQPPPPAHLSPTTSCPPPSPQQGVQHQSSHRPTAPSLHSLTSASSSFIVKRFADSELYLGSAVERDNARKAGQRWAPRAARGDIIQVLFWIGFIAPWCWLIGGWIVEPRPPVAYASRAHGGGLLPLWTGRGTNVQRIDSVKMKHGYPFVAPSVTSLAPVSYSRVVLTPKPLNPPKNPWVRRCRIAAVTSGVIIVVAFVITLIVVGRNSG